MVGDILLLVYIYKGEGGRQCHICTKNDFSIHITQNLQYKI